MVRAAYISLPTSPVKVIAARFADLTVFQGAAGVAFKLPDRQTAAKTYGWII